MTTQINEATTEAGYKHSVVTAVNSSLIILDNDQRRFLGEQKANGVEVGDTVEWGDNGASFLTHLVVLVKKDGTVPAAGEQKPPAKGKNSQTPPKTCVMGDCQDKAQHFVFNEQRNRWECNITGMDNPNITNCPLVPKKVTGSSEEYDKKALAAGFGTQPKDKVPVVGVYLGNNDTAIMLKINDKNTPYYATPDLIKYLRSKDCKAKVNEAVTLTMELKPQDLGSGAWATAIGPASETEQNEQKQPAETPPQKTDAPAGQPAGSPPAAPVEAAKLPKQQNSPAKPPTNPGAAPVFRKAARKMAKLRVGLCGTAGSGKTYDSLMIAFGVGGPIAVIDTENSSAELYAHLGEYDVCVLSAPFTAQKYTDAIHAAERAGYNVIIIDSLTHAWAGEGGLLDLKDNIAKNSKSNNSFTAWKDVTPLHRGLVDAMLQSPCHIIATMRSKTEYVIDTDDRGRSFPRKIGMAPVQREGMDYEFTLVFDIDAAHIATASKDRTSLFTGKSFQPSIETGRQLKEWLETETFGGA